AIRIGTSVASESLGERDLRNRILQRKGARRYDLRPVPIGRLGTGLGPDSVPLLQGSDATIFLYSASVRAFSVSVRRLPWAPIASAMRAAVASSGNSPIATPS